MEENDVVNFDTSNEAETTGNTEGEQQGEETITIPKKKWDEVQNQKRHWQEKAEKKPESKSEEQIEKKIESGLSQKDVIYLAKAEIHDDDVDEVLTLSQKMGWDVKKAHDYLKPVLAEREEHRKTELAMQTKGTQRTSVKSSPDTVISEAAKAKWEDDTSINVDPSKLAEARMAQKMSKLGQQ